MKSIFDMKYQLYRSYINPYLLELIPRDSSVLDVGCSGGQFGKILQETKNCVVYGIDVSTAAINEAKHFLKNAQVMDVEKDIFPFEGNQFSIILFGDVLEHLIFPEIALARFKSYIEPNGKIIISIPNVAFIGMRVRLIFGNWDYQPSGIMDETHLRFYTRKTAAEMIMRCGLTIKAIKISPGINFPKSDHRFLSKLAYKICEVWPTLLAYQFIFIAECEQNKR